MAFIYQANMFLYQFNTIWWLRWSHLMLCTVWWVTGEVRCSWSPLSLCVIQQCYITQILNLSYNCCTSTIQWEKFTMINVDGKIDEYHIQGILVWLSTVVLPKTSLLHWNRVVYSSALLTGNSVHLLSHPKQKTKEPQIKSCFILLGLINLPVEQTLVVSTKLDKGTTCSPRTGAIYITVKKGV